MPTYITELSPREIQGLLHERPDSEDYDRKVTAALLLTEYSLMGVEETVTFEKYQQIRGAAAYLLAHYCTIIPQFLSGVTADDLRLI